jgi:hypothetical protein
VTSELNALLKVLKAILRITGLKGNETQFLKSDHRMVSAKRETEKERE